MPRRNRNATRRAWQSPRGRWLVVDSAFNRANVPHLIGKRFDVPPSYCAVERIGRKRAA